jgi:RHS repeat-associated protein
VAGTTSNYAYTYDPMGRLLTVTKDGSLVEQYQYNQNGTRISEVNALRGISSRSFAYSDEDHLLTAGSTTYQYDADGFLLSKTNGTEKTEYAYSSRGELLQVKLPDTRVIDFYHDPLGRRIAKVVNGTITEKYLWQGMTRLLAVYDGSNNLLMRFNYADDRMPVSMTKSGTTYYLTYDQVGTLRVVSDVSGNVVKKIDYDSFGNIVNDTNPSFTIPFGFAGGLHDRDTGLVRFGYRDFDPDIGRWAAKDPIGFKAWDMDLYGYSLGNPVNWTDPYGLAVCENFVESLIRDWESSEDATDLGKKFLRSREITLSLVTGFKPELVSGGQRGGVSRHIYGHAGVLLQYGSMIGGAISQAVGAQDYLQRYQKGRTTAESEAELAGNRAAREVAKLFKTAFENRKQKNACMSAITDKLRDDLSNVLCQ